MDMNQVARQTAAGPEANENTLQDQVVLVTGGSRGIGRQIVLQAAARGARVVFCARTIGEQALAVQEEVERLAGPGRVIAVRADVSSEDDVEALFDAALRAFGRVDVVVNNAGISPPMLLVSIPAEVWDQVIAINLTGAFLVSRRAIQEFLAQGHGGAIVSLSSIMQHGAPSNASYAASKGGLVGLTRAIARDYGDHGVRAHLVIVGPVETELTKDVPEAMKQAVVGGCPQKRHAETAEIASVVLFLASQRVGLSNGEAVHVAGGLREVNL
jgi:3-oxoacyl-[acyl-carrier protein] reductase